MRRAFAAALVEIARVDTRVMLLTGDLGYQVLEPFIEACPDRFINAGVAEQNMVGMATGLAERGFIPFVYSIATFAVLRPFEFIRNGPVLHHLPVRVVGVGGGFDYGMNGVSHYGLEDLAVLRCLPSLTIVAPADHRQAVSALSQTWDADGPVYYRIGRDEHAVVAGLDGRFACGRANIVCEGQDLVIVTTGSIAIEVMHAADELRRDGIQSTVVVVASISPAPVDDLAEVLSRHRVAMTVEAHALNGGLGSLVCEVVAERGIACRVERCAAAEPDGLVGSPEYLHERHGLSRRQLAARGRALCASRQ